MNSVLEYNVVDARPAELHGAAHQPSGRDEVSSALNGLQRSIASVGLQYPPLVIRRPDGDGYTIVDGHRRIAAIKAMGWPKIPVLVSEGRSEELFAAVCGSTRPVTATQWIDVYLKGGEIPSGPTKVNIKRLDETVGRDFLEKLVEQKLSPQIWSLANRVANYLELGPEDKAKILTWLLDNKITRQVAAWITGGNPKPQLKTAFQNNLSPVL